MLFASASDDFYGKLLVLSFLVAIIVRKAYQAYTEWELRNKDPQAYVRLKQMEHEAEQRKKDRKLAAFKIGVGIGKWFWR